MSVCAPAVPVWLRVCVLCVYRTGMNTYEQAGVPRATLHRALRQLGPGALKAGLRAAWSSVTYDAKAWSILQERASDGALFWNVGK
eukprot:COSAG01_NODE_3928_length_5526_cov_8.623803_4_plen_86_part_00